MIRPGGGASLIEGSAGPISYLGNTSLELILSKLSLGIAFFPTTFGRQFAMLGHSVHLQVKW